MKTWTKIRNPNVQMSEPVQSFKPGKLIAADEYGQPVETNTSLMDLGRRLVEAKREARKSREVLEIMAAAQVQENESLRHYCQDLESRFNRQNGVYQEEFDAIINNISQIEEDLNDIKVIDDLRMLGSNLNSVKKRVLLNENARLKDAAALYNYVSNKVYLEKRERLAQTAEAAQAFNKLGQKLYWLTAALTVSYGLLLWGLLS